MIVVNWANNSAFMIMAYDRTPSIFFQEHFSYKTQQILTFSMTRWYYSGNQSVSKSF